MTEKPKQNENEIEVAEVSEADLENIAGGGPGGNAVLEQPGGADSGAPIE